MSSRYHLHERLARGGMAEIFLGTHTGDDGFRRICCIKRIRSEFVKDQAFVNMFRDEAHICKRLQHPNIVRVEGFEKVGGSYAIIMELVKGCDLRALLAACEKSGIRLPIPVCLYIIAEAARGLQHAHSKRDDIDGRHLAIVHRDVSPQNILVSFEGEVKVTDFGIAEAENRATETSPGVVKGKYAYMSPEQISGKGLDHTTDIFALSVVLWEILAMEKLFWAESEVQTIRMVTQCEIRRDLRAFHPDIDDGLYQVVMRGLNPRPSDRYRQIEELEAAARQILSTRYPSFNVGNLRELVCTVLADRVEGIAAQVRDAMQAPLPEPAARQPQPPPATTKLRDSSENAQLAPPAPPPSVVAPTDLATPESTPTQQRAATQSGGSVPPPVRAPRTAPGSSPRFSSSSQNSRLTRGTHSGARSASRSQRSKTKERRRGNNLMRLGIVIVGMLIALITGLVIWKKSRDTSLNWVVEASLELVPERFRVALDDEPLFQDTYVSSPLGLRMHIRDGRLSLRDSSGRMARAQVHDPRAAKLSLTREGFETIFFTLADILDRGGVAAELTPDQPMAPTRIAVLGGGSTWIVLGDLREHQQVNGQVDLNYVVFGIAQELRVYPNGTSDSTGAFVCRFTPRAKNWSAPYNVLIHLDQGSCTYPYRL